MCFPFYGSFPFVDSLEEAQIFAWFRGSTYLILLRFRSTPPSRPHCPQPFVSPIVC